MFVSKIANKSLQFPTIDRRQNISLVHNDLTFCLTDNTSSKKIILSWIPKKLSASFNYTVKNDTKYHPAHISCGVLFIKLYAIDVFYN